MERLKRTEKNTLTERVLQFGEGNFLRGFVDWMIDKLNKENGRRLRCDNSSAACGRTC